MKLVILFFSLSCFAYAAFGAPSPKESYNLVRQAVATVRFNEAEHNVMAEALSVLKQLVEKEDQKSKKKKDD